MGVFGHWVGRAIALVLLTIVNLFVFTPVAFFMWLFRYDALAPGVRRDASSFWHGHTGRALPKRQFADERTLFAPVGATRAPRRPVLRIATVVGVVRADPARRPRGRLGLRRGQQRDARHRGGGRRHLRPAERARAARQPVGGRGAGGAGRASRAWPIRTSATGSATRRQTYTNIVDGVRTSYQSQAPGKKVSVWFFGASALFGDGQRDDHTIPSEFAAARRGRRHPARGAQLRPARRRHVAGARAVPAAGGVGAEARPGGLLRRVQRPRVADEPRAQRRTHQRVRPHAQPDHQRRRQRGRRHHQSSGGTSSSGSGTTWGDVADAYWDQSASHHVYDALHDLIAGSDEPKVQFAKGVDQKLPAQTPAQITEAARNAISIQSRAATLATAVAGSVGADARVLLPARPCSPRSCSPDEQKYRTPRHLRTSALGSRDPAGARTAAEHPVHRCRRRARLRDDAGAVGLRAHQRGGRPPRRRCALRQPPAATAGAGRAAVRGQ